MRENEYQAKLIDKIKQRIPGCEILKNDSMYRQGIPDLSVFAPNGKWAWLEVKKGKNEAHQPNQDDYVDWANKCCYGSFIFPENEEEVLDELQQALGY